MIARFFAPIAGAAGLGLLDDAALLTPMPGAELVLTCDALSAGVHFFPDDPPQDIAAKALGVNLSDLSAKGAEPLGCLLSLCLPADWRPDWLERFAAGFGHAAADAACPLLGGDTTRSPGALTLSVTAIGQVPAGRMIRRSGARPGDRLYVSGMIGDAALGLALRLNPDAPWAAGLSEAMRRHVLERYLRPRPRLALISALRAFAHAAMDISDGFAGDFAKLLAASGLGGEVDLACLPVSEAAAAALAADPAVIKTIAAGGDDYEILCSVPAAAAADFEAAAKAAGVPVATVGIAGEAGSATRILLGGRMVDWPALSFAHF